jgi:hypothetical protein
VWAQDLQAQGAERARPWKWRLLKSRRFQRKLRRQVVVRQSLLVHKCDVEGVLPLPRQDVV